MIIYLSKKSPINVNCEKYLSQWSKLVTLCRNNSKIVDRQTLNSYDLMNTIYFKDFFSILLHFRERERQLQETVNVKHDCVPTGRAIFNWLCF